MRAPTWVALIAACLLGALCSAQEQPPDTTTATQPQVAADSARGPSPMGSFFKSLLVPGWAQAELDRDLTGALFVAFEGLAMAMTLKANEQVAYLESIGSPAAEGKRQEREDWAVLWVFNHLFSGLEAFVAAHLAGFPEDLRIRVIPGGVALQIPWAPLR